MIGTRASFYAFRRGFFYVAAVADVLLRVLVGSTHFRSMTWGSTESAGDLASVGMETLVAFPVVAVAVVMSSAAFLVAQGLVRIAGYLRFVAATLLVGSLLAYTYAPGLSAFVAFLAYGVLASGRWEEVD